MHFILLYLIATYTYSAQAPEIDPANATQWLRTKAGQSKLSTLQQRLKCSGEGWSSTGQWLRTKAGQNILSDLNNALRSDIGYDCFTLSQVADEITRMMRLDDYHKKSANLKQAYKRSRDSYSTHCYTESYQSARQAQKDIDSSKATLAKTHQEYIPPSLEAKVADPDSEFHKMSIELLNALLKDANAEADNPKLYTDQLSPMGIEPLSDFPVLAIHRDLLETIRYLCEQQQHMAETSYRNWYKERTSDEQMAFRSSLSHPAERAKLLCPIN
ncbi:MAG: hypothetical protein OXC30_01365 [Alphaproteobacteria bacterium]|nr:hypothetical protein [Alphaproteobacteria bacterium]